MLKDMLSKTSIANVIAGFSIAVAVVYAAWKGDSELLRSIMYLAAGYLFGVTAPRNGGQG